MEAGSLICFRLSVGRVQRKRKRKGREERDLVLQILQKRDRQGETSGESPIAQCTLVVPMPLRPSAITDLRPAAHLSKLVFSKSPFRYETSHNVSRITPTHSEIHKASSSFISFLRPHFPRPVTFLPLPLSRWFRLPSCCFFPRPFLPPRSLLALRRPSVRFSDIRRMVLSTSFVPLTDIARPPRCRPRRRRRRRAGRSTSRGAPEENILSSHHRRRRRLRDPLPHYSPPPPLLLQLSLFRTAPPLSYATISKVREKFRSGAGMKREDGRPGVSSPCLFPIVAVLEISLVFDPTLQKMVTLLPPIRIATHE